MRKIVIRVQGPWALKGDRLLLVGDCDALGNWNPGKGVSMKSVQGIVWSAELESDELPGHFEFKFVKVTPKGEMVWEEGFNRPFDTPSQDGRIVCDVPEAIFPGPRPRYAGTAVPVFSLRSRTSQGIGDFTDIKLLVDWAVVTGQSVLQLLPVNDTNSSHTWTDSYPYGGITIMALNPVYLNIFAAGKLSDRRQMAAFRKEADELNGLTQMDYERVYNLKMRYLRELFALKGDEIMAKRPYVTFRKNNRSWLLPYAAFCLLNDKNGTADFTKWGEYAEYSDAKANALYSDPVDGRSMELYIFIQYLLDSQLKSAHDYASGNGVALKGDIPIGITRSSVEAWAEPEYFNMGEQAGAPPDFFSADGQNWGFPTYNWVRMEEDGFSWWRRRFKKMAEYFDAFRIDHVLGFFRIWEIPLKYKSGKMGHFSPALPYTSEEMRRRGFYFSREAHAVPAEGTDDTNVLFVEDPVRKDCYHPRIGAQETACYASLQQWEKDAFNRLYDEFFFFRHNDFWRDLAMRKLPQLIESTDMLTCAEDLGMVPACVPSVLDSLRILSLKVQRMPADMSEKLGKPYTYPYMCVCTTGSHDTSTLRGWWGELHDGADCPVRDCCWIVAEHMHSPAMLAILPLQDWFSIDESMRTPDPALDRINDPSNPKHYWRWRMHVNLEDMVKNDRFNNKVSTMIKEGGRIR